MLSEPWLARPPGEHLICLCEGPDLSHLGQLAVHSTKGFSGWRVPRVQMGAFTQNQKSKRAAFRLKAAYECLFSLTLGENLVPRRLSFDLQTQSCMLAFHYPPQKWHRKSFVKQLDPVLYGSCSKWQTATKSSWTETSNFGKTELKYQVLKCLSSKQCNRQTALMMALK